MSGRRHRRLARGPWRPCGRPPAAGPFPAGSPPHWAHRRGAVGIVVPRRHRL